MHRIQIVISKEISATLSAIRGLQDSIKSGTLLESEIVLHNDMINKKKKALVYKMYFENKKTKTFSTCKDGRIKSHNPQCIANTEDELIGKLYNYYFDTTLESVYKKWLRYRARTQIVANGTIKEDRGLWNRFIANSRIAQMQIADIRLKHLIALFHLWTGNGFITRKALNNRKSLLNNIFNYAVINEIINFNPITSLPCNDFKYKLPNAHTKAYTLTERTKLLEYLDTLESDGYVLAIKLAFYGIFRIGEIKGLSWDIANGNKVEIQAQLVDERTLQEDLTLSSPKRVTKLPKGNPNYSIRTLFISQKGVDILTEMKTLNPTGELLFMYEGRPLTTNTFNKRLQKYCMACDIPYLSSHKIRFTGASMLRQAGVNPIDIQPLLGHSTLAMTQHYIGERVEAIDTSKMATILV